MDPEGRSALATEDLNTLVTFHFRGVFNALNRLTPKLDITIDDMTLLWTGQICCAIVTAYYTFFNANVNKQFNVNKLFNVD